MHDSDNVSAQFTDTIVLDTTPPAAPSTPDLAAASDSGASSTDNITNDDTPTFTGEAETGATVQLLEGAVVLGTATANSPWSITATALSNGIHTITVRATDLAGNASALSPSLSVTIDTLAPPVLTLPANITDEATGPSGAMVSYTASATDLVDGVRPVTCAPPSGSTFPIGTTTVNCSASDTHGNTASGSFTVMVQDTTPPVIAAHADVTAEATSGAGTAVSYTSPATSDAVDGAGIASCLPASGSTFPLGNTTVTCTATDAHGNAATPTTFVVHVVDTTPPVTTISGATDGNGLSVAPGGSTLSSSITFAFSASDAVGVIGFECSLNSGAFSPCTSPGSYTGLAVGNHTFQVRATDTAGNTDPTPASLAWTVATPAQANQSLINAVSALDVPPAVQNSLSAPLGQASAILNDGNPNNDGAACGKLQAFLNQVDARQRSGALTPAKADQLRQQTNAIIVALGC